MEIKFEGIGFCGALFITFLILKLCNVIDWSWWWITTPLWIPLVIAVISIIISLVVIIFNSKDGY